MTYYTFYDGPLQEFAVGGFGIDIKTVVRVRVRVRVGVGMG